MMATTMTMTEWEKETSSPGQIALLRMKFLQRDTSVASVFVPLFAGAVEAFLANVESFAARTALLRRILYIHLNITKRDSVLNEEVGREGTHVLLTRLMNYDAVERHRDEAEQDVVIELQDVAGEIASYPPFPFHSLPFSLQEVKSRLPRAFSFPSSKAPFDGATTVYIQQVTTRQSAQEDVGFVMWPSAVILANWLVRGPSLQLGGKRVLELGAGCGLAGLVAAQLQKQQRFETWETEKPCVYLSDFNSTVLHNLENNVSLNDVTGNCRVVGLDFYQQTGTASTWKNMKDEQEEPVDVVLAADVICKATDAVAVASTVHDALKPGGRAYVVCADAAHRFGVEHFATECRKVGLQVTTQDVKDMFGGKLLFLEDLNRTTGYVEGMSLTAFAVTKSPKKFLPRDNCPRKFKRP